MLPTYSCSKFSKEKNHLESFSKQNCSRNAKNVEIQLNIRRKEDLLATTIVLIIFWPQKCYLNYWELLGTKFLLDFLKHAKLFKGKFDIKFCFVLVKFVLGAASIEGMDTFINTFEYQTAVRVATLILIFHSKNSRYLIFCTQLL